MSVAPLAGHVRNPCPQVSLPHISDGHLQNEGRGKRRGNTGMIMRAQWPALLGEDDLTIAQIVSE